MIEEKKGPENRTSERSSTARPAIWAMEGNPETRIGWMLESSDTGCAFAWRGKHTPVPGEVILLSADETEEPLRMSRALVKRVNAVHDDLSIIAVRILPERAREVMLMYAEVKVPPAAVPAGPPAENDGASLPADPSPAESPRIEPNAAA